MSREIKEDYKNLENFIESYNLKKIKENEELVNFLKPMHKNLFALMTFFVELEYQNKNHSLMDSGSIEYLKESISDMGQSLFCWIQGAYKPSSFLLRSSIETFIKSLAGMEENSIFTEKSMYKVFNIAKNTFFFNNGIELYEKIHNSYKLLCEVAHTASMEKMAHISALKTFPLFSKNNATLLSIEFCKLSTAILSLLYINYYSLVCKMHHKNMNNFMKAIPKNIKKTVNEEMANKTN
jgi:hypothetical protein